MRDEFKIEARVDFKCGDCGQHTAIPALKVVPGIKCIHCGAMFQLGPAAYAAKATLLAAALGRNDVKVD